MLRAAVEMNGGKVPVRVLVVEDEALIAMVLVDILDDLGCTVVAVAATMADALPKCETSSFDLAILDVRVAGDFVFPGARAIARRGIPYILATGSGGDELPADLTPSSVLGKPYGAGAVESAVLKALAERVPA